MSDGLLAMILDLVLQLSGTIGVYVAGFQGIHVIYQLSAVTAAMPTYAAYAMSMSYVVKLTCSVLVGAKLYTDFAFVMKIFVCLSVVLGAIAAVSIFPFYTQVAAAYSVQACEFAREQSCLGIYEGLFANGQGSSDTVFRTFIVFCVTAAFTCVFSAAKAGLYCCQDFEFMAKSSGLVFAIVLMPGILIARLAFGSATALYVATSLPTWILTLIFLGRLQQNMSKMVKGHAGPWDANGGLSEGLVAIAPATQAELSPGSAQRSSQNP